MKKIVGILVMMLLITTTVLPVLGTINKHKINLENIKEDKSINNIRTNIDYLDQHQECSNTRYKIGHPAEGLAFYCQSFKPEKKYLSKIEVQLNTVGNVEDKFVVQILHDEHNSTDPNLCDFPLRTREYPADWLSTSPYWWTVVLHPWIEVYPGKPYFIEVAYQYGTEENYIEWCAYKEDSYPECKYLNGKGWTDPHPSFIQWHPMDDVDFCFKTYGYDYDELPPIVNLGKPLPECVYVGDIQFFRLPEGFTWCLVIGEITIEVDAIDNETGIKEVIFEIKDLSIEDTDPPYTYTYDKTNFGKITAKVTAIDNTGNIATDEITFFMLNLERR